VINEYNHHMKGVDHANQLRAATTVCRPREHRIWIPLWQFCFEVSTVNAYICWSFGKSSKNRLHRAFIQELITALLRSPLASEAIGRVPESVDNWSGHEWSKFPTRNYCKWCRMTIKARRRTPLGDITNQADSGIKTRGRSTLGGCKKCNTYLCSTGTCFRQFHSFKLQ
jgi:hypothetical protein